MNKKLGAIREQAIKVREKLAGGTGNLLPVLRQQQEDLVWRKETQPPS